MNNLFDIADKVISFASKNNFEYCDIRAEEIRKKVATIEDGEIENIITKEDAGLGIRILNSGTWSFFSISNPSDFFKIKEKIMETPNPIFHKNPVKLAPVPIIEDNIIFPVKKNPDLADLISIGKECSKIMTSKKNITKTSVNLLSNNVKKYFSSTEGAKITQNYTDTIVDLMVTAHGNGLTQSVNTTEGGRGGIEIISEKNGIFKIADEISDSASSLLFAKPAKTEKTKVVLNPDFVSLLTHEILGHPSEGDRVLGKEMAWAGGSWWAGKIGQKIGSNNLNVFDDPTINGMLGWYKYDDEGVKSSKTILIEEGILKNHLQSRETASIFNSKPTANMRATSYKFMPLIRMACTCISGGDWNQQEMISEIKNGYLISNMKIPSIDMKRYNWSISCQFAHKIENGEITDLVRDVIVAGTSPDFFKSIDACGKDFTVRQITNCGKGDPMQSMMMGNGGPSIRGEAIVKSV